MTETGELPDEELATLIETFRERLRATVVEQLPAVNAVNAVKMIEGPDVAH